MCRDDIAPSCAADALQGTRLVKTARKRVGIAALDETITEVMGLGLHELVESPYRKGTEKI